MKEYFTDETLHDQIIVLGDFNFPHLKWKYYDDVVIANTQTGGTIDHQQQAENLLELTSDLFLEQKIVTPTRENNVLDLLFTNDEDLIKITNTADTFISDHRMITASINIATEKTPLNESEITSCSKLELFSFWSDKSNWEAVNNHLSEIDWNSVMTSESDVKSNLETFYEKCYEACVDNIPKKKKPKKSNIPHDRKVLMRKRRLLNNRLINARTNKKKDKLNKSYVISRKV